MNQARAGTGRITRGDSRRVEGRWGSPTPLLDDRYGEVGFKTTLFRSSEAMIR